MKIKEAEIPKEFTIDEIKAKGCRYFDILMEDLNGPSRKNEIKEPRFIVMMFIKKYTTLSLKAIGRSFNGRDHSTVIHALGAIQEMIDTERAVRAKVKGFEDYLLYDTPVLIRVVKYPKLKGEAWAI